MPVGRQTFESTLFTLGHLEEIPANRSVLSTRIPGRIVELHTFIGDQVKKGQTLAVLESRQPGNPPPRIELKASQSGVIVETHISKGEPVEPENELLAIADHSQLWAIAHVPETSIPQTPIGTEARIHILALGSEKITGKIDRFRTEADPENATLDAILRIDNPNGLLRPQMAAEFHFVIKRREGILAVPNSAIQGSRTQPVVFVKDFELANAFVKAPVVVGESNDEYTEILKGLFEGDDVIANGGYALSYAAPDSGVSLKEALDAAHGHEHHEDGSEMTPAQLKAREKNDALFCRRHWEHKSIVQNGIRTKDINRVKALDATKITMEQSAYFYFDDGSLLNMTRSLGHYPTSSIVKISQDKDHALSCAEHSLTKVVVERKTDVKYAIINATDGVWDVTAEDVEKTFLDSIAEDDNAAEICVRKVKQLWCQEWEYWYLGINTGNTSLPDWNHDDIGCSVAYC